MELNFVDFVIIAIVAVSIFFGFRKGLIKEFFSIIGIFLGLFLAVNYKDTIIRFAENRWDMVLLHNKTAVFIIVFLFTILIFSIIGRMFTSFSGRHFTLTMANRAGGALFGLIRGVIIVVLILFLMLNLSLPPAINLQIYRSNLSPLLLNHSIKTYRQIVKVFPHNSKFSDIDFVSARVMKSKGEQLDNTLDLDSFQNFLNNIVEDKNNYIPAQIKQLKKGGANETE